MHSMGYSIPLQSHPFLLADLTNLALHVRPVLMLGTELLVCVAVPVSLLTAVSWISIHLAILARAVMDSMAI